MLSRIGTALAAGIALLVVYQLYVGGNALLAAACAGGLGLAFFIYTARSGYTYRYLFPGLAGIALFVVLPLVYTVWIGFTNYGAKNLLTFERATEVLLGEVYLRDTVRYQFTLHADGGGFRIVLRTDEDAESGSGGSDPGIPDGSSGLGFGATGSDSAGSGAAGSAGSAGAGSGAAGSAGAGSGAAGSAGAGSGAAGSAGAGSGAAGSAGAGSGAAGSAGAGSDGSAGAGSAGALVPRPPRPPTVFVTPVLPLTGTATQGVKVVPLADAGFSPGEELPLKEVIARSDAIKAITVRFPDGTAAAMATLREFTPYQALYLRNPDGTLTNQKTQERLTPSFETGFYEKRGGQQVEPGFRVVVGGSNYARVFTDAKYRGPFLRVFAWTLVFAGLSVLITAALGMLLAELLQWEGLRFAGVYRVLLFLPYAVPGFISILVFKGLFNRNFGEINLILEGLLGIRPDWTEDALLARVMILIVNTWLGYPYFMLMCMGLQKSIPHDLYEASALAGAGPLTNFFRITWPLIRKPLTPLLVASFAYNFNNFVLIFLLTKGKPDFLDTAAPAGETDLLVTYTYRTAFDAHSFGLAAAISTIIFAMVAILSIVNLRLTKAAASDSR